MTSQAVHSEDDLDESEDDITSSISPAATHEDFRERVFKAGYHMVSNFIILLLGDADFLLV